MLTCVRLCLRPPIQLGRLRMAASLCLVSLLLDLDAQFSKLFLLYRFIQAFSFISELSKSVVVPISLIALLRIN